MRFYQLAVLLCGVVAAYAEDPVSGRTLLADGERPPLRIGVMHSYSDDAPDDSDLGDALAIINGVYFAVADSGYKAQVVVNNSACTLETAKETILSMVNDHGIDALIGPGCSGVVLAMAPLLNELKIPALAPSAGALNVSAAGPYIYRATTVATLYMDPLMEAVAAKYNSCAFISDNTLIGRDWTRLATEAYTKFGGRIVDVVSFDAERASVEDVADLTSELMTQEPESLYFMTSFSTPGELAATIILTARSQNKDFPLVGPNGVPYEGLELLAQSDEYNEPYYPLMYGIMAAGDKYYANTDQRYARAFGLDESGGLDPKGGANYANSYNAAAAIIAAAEKADKSSPKPEDIQRELSNSDFKFKGWAGVMKRFDDNGDISAEIEVMVFDEYAQLTPYTP